MRARLSLLAAAAALAGGMAAAQPAPPAFTAAQADRGHDLYAARCAVCHGAHMDDGEFAPSLNSARFRRQWGSAPPAALYAYVSRTMPPGQAGVLAPDEYDAVLAYLYQANGYTPGDKPLAAEPADNPLHSDRPPRRRGSIQLDA